ncbi:hypothetical protein Tco_0737200 [Tanacetum coccineum]
MFLEKLASDTFSGTQGEDVMEHIEKFLKIIRPINIQNVSNSRLWINVFPISLTEAASEWFKEERMGSIATWLSRSSIIYCKLIPTCSLTMFLGKIIMNNTRMIGSMNGMTRYRGWRDDGYSNGGNLPGQYQVGNQIHYQDHEWYEALEDSDMKREALRNKAELEKSMNQEEESNGDAWSSNSPIDEWSDQEEVNNKEPDVNYDPYLDIARLFNSHTKKEEGKDDQGKNKSIGEQDNHLVRGHERCGKSKLIEDPRTKSPGCKTEGFEVVKYIFGPTERYVAIKKHGEYECMTTEENACHAYQDIFHKMQKSLT